MMYRRPLIFALTLLLMSTVTMSVFAQYRTRSTTTRSYSYRGLPKHPNSYYYNADGSFNEENGRAAMRQLFQYHRYSLGEAVLDAIEGSSLAGDKIWILDFNLGDFSNVGMGGVFFVNDKEHGYFGHEIYLLPYQMIPQHFHIAAEGKPAKHEAWQVRHGKVWCFAEGGTLDDLDQYPPEVKKALKSQIDSGTLTCFKAKELNVGEMTLLAKLVQPHFMMAGPEGAIVTEYASYHSGRGLRFSNPKAKGTNTTAKSDRTPAATEVEEKKEEPLPPPVKEEKKAAKKNERLEKRMERNINRAEKTGGAKSGIQIDVQAPGVHVEKKPGEGVKIDAPGTRVEVKPAAEKP